MIYGSASFLGIPIKTLIKHYREKLGTKSFDKVSDYADNFFQFYENEISCPESVQLENLKELLYKGLQVSSIINVASEHVKVLVIDGNNDQNIPPLENYLIDHFKRIINYHNVIFNASKPSSLQNVDIEPFQDDFNNYIQAIFKTININQPPQELKQIALKAAEITIRNTPIDNIGTGFVFTGYGKEELFPSMVSYETNGCLKGKIKYFKKSDIDIDREDQTFHLEAFAQKDMVDQFVKGIDDNLYLELHNAFKATVKMHLANDTDYEDVYKNFMEKIYGYQYERERSISEMIEVMPKPDLAALAESMVELTSIRRKASTDIETVGGPVDIALISKGEGFIWVKRKHYFDSALNGRYMARNSIRSIIQQEAI